MRRLPSLTNVETPALLVDGPTLVQNIARMAERVRNAGVALWPHCKTHKTPEIAALQREHGAAGLTVATLREAEVFAAAGHSDLLVVYPPVGRERLERLTELARTARVRVVLDSEAALAGLDDACRTRAWRSAGCGKSTAGRGGSGRSPVGRPPTSSRRSCSGIATHPSTASSRLPATCTARRTSRSCAR